MKKFYSSMLLLLAAMFGFNVMANNLTITNVSLTGATANTIQVQYNMFWENSWRDLENWDAVWVFVKYTTNNGTTWAHATMSTSGHVAGTSSPGAAIQIPQDNMGAFIYRSTVSSGTFTITGQQLQWNFVANGLNQSQASSATVRVFGVEMVYIPQGEYFLGDGVNNTGTATPSTSAFRRSDDLVAVYVGNQFSDIISDPISGLTFRIHGNLGVDLNDDQIVGTWPTDAPDFPVGYKHFYCMKHEITQGQYADFLNTLTYSQQDLRVGSTTNIPGESAWNGLTTSLPTHRFNIFVLTAGVNSTVPRVYTATRPDRSCNFLSYMDGAAYADWAALRPMTEFEFEKTARGPIPPVQGEYAWGSVTATVLSSITASIENGTEAPTTTTMNYNRMSTTQSVSGGDGIFNASPVRAGIFARSNSTRQTSGASYYGVMDLTGNMTESVVYFSNLAGRSYTGLHGNGVLNAAGAADVSFWPGINGNGTTTTANIAYQGSTGVTSGAGTFFKDISSTTNIYTVSWRISTTTTARSQQRGFRAVKSNL
jgi:formylglycine-generating enzyme required for sulfatase activity